MSFLLGSTLFPSFACSGEKKTAFTYIFREGLKRSANFYVKIHKDWPDGTALSGATTIRAKLYHDSPENLVYQCF